MLLVAENVFYVMTIKLNQRVVVNAILELSYKMLLFSSREARGGLVLDDSLGQWVIGYKIDHGWVTWVIDLAYWPFPACCKVLL